MHRAIGITGALVAALVLYLFIEVRAEPEIEVDQAKIAAARKRASARQRMRQRTRPKPTASREPEVRVRAPDEGDDDKSSESSSSSASPRPLAAAGMSHKSIRAVTPDLEGKPFVSKVKAARRLYGRRRYEQAYALALELLEEEPKNRRVLRVAVASSCIMANPDDAAHHFEKLKLPRDRKQMRRRCKAYGVELPEE